MLVPDTLRVESKPLGLKVSWSKIQKLNALFNGNENLQPPVTLKEEYASFFDSLFLLMKGYWDWEMVFPGEGRFGIASSKLNYY